MNPILMKDFIVIDVKEEYEGDFSNFNGTFVPSTNTPLYSTTIEIQKDRGDLDRQINRLVNYSISKNPKDLKIFSDVGSGLNDNRKFLNLLLKEVEQDKIDRIFITYKDRLTRFGFNYLKFICDSHNTEIVIMSDEEEHKSVEEELMEDLLLILHVFVILLLIFLLF